MQCSVKKKKLFERSEFFFFSETEERSSAECAALTFCFFSVKGKEKENFYKIKALILKLIINF
jgi:hypothetical protein